MKSKLVAFILLFSAVLKGQSSCDIGRTFFAPRSLTYNLILENALTWYNFYHNALDYEYDVAAGVYTVPLYARSCNARDVATFFLPQGVCKLQDGHIKDQDFGLSGLIERVSQLHIAPQREVVGSYCTIIIPLSAWSPNLWTSISAAIVQVSHDINLKQTDLCDDYSMLACTHPDLKFGKFSKSSMKYFGVDDILIKGGYNWYWDDENHIGCYILAGIPTGKKNKAEFIFEPIVGSRHAAAGVGLVSDIGGWIADDQYLNFMLEAQYRYIVSEKGIRTFDLDPYGSLSRYVSMTDDMESTTIKPVINYCTQEVTIRPNSRLQLWAALHYELYKFNWELGYNYWGRSKDTICNLGFDKELILCTGLSNSINQDNPSMSDMNQVIGNINRDNFNLNSAEHPSTSSHTVYMACSYNGEIDNCPGIIGLGVSYEYAKNNAAFEQLMLWTKLGFVF